MFLFPWLIISWAKIPINKNINPIIIKKIINKASSLIKRNGKFILEIGFDQKKVVLNILKKNCFYVDKVHKDYGNNDRCIISTKI